jgi:outer membrane protein OmpA-like peptidoglycan-associated protein
VSLVCAEYAPARAGRQYGGMSLCRLLYRLACAVLMLVSGCAVTTGQQQAAGNAPAGIAVVPLDDGALRVDMSTDAAFDYGSAVLRPAVAAQLVRIMQPYHGRPLRISAYSDNVGAAAYNLDLTQRRAEAVGHVLREQGFSIPPQAVSGYGDGNPVATNATAAGRRLNRRIEIRIDVKPSADG